MARLSRNKYFEKRNGEVLITLSERYVGNIDILDKDFLKEKGILNPENKTKLKIVKKCYEKYCKYLDTVHIDKTSLIGYYLRILERLPEKYELYRLFHIDYVNVNLNPYVKEKYTQKAFDHACDYMFGYSSIKDKFVYASRMIFLKVCISIVTNPKYKTWDENKIYSETFETTGNVCCSYLVKNILFTTIYNYAYNLAYCLCFNNKKVKDVMGELKDSLSSFLSPIYDEYITVALYKNEDNEDIIKVRYFDYYYTFNLKTELIKLSNYPNRAYYYNSLCKPHILSGEMLKSGSLFNVSSVGNLNNAEDLPFYLKDLVIGYGEFSDDKFKKDFDWYSGLILRNIDDDRKFHFQSDFDAQNTIVNCLGRLSLLIMLNNEFNIVHFRRLGVDNGYCIWNDEIESELKVLLKAGQETDLYKNIDYGYMLLGVIKSFITQKLNMDYCSVLSKLIHNKDIKEGVMTHYSFEDCLLQGNLY